MNITHTYDTPTGDEKAIEVTFTCDTPDLTHIRSVNAVFDADGSYNPGLTEARVVEVGLGVKNKITVGVIAVPVEEE
tara:strand:- start:572 stop:802 length:231 start_codon:yes stop_codon:yes gene_type:complete